MRCLYVGSLFPLWLWILLRHLALCVKTTSVTVHWPRMNIVFEVTSGLKLSLPKRVNFRANRDQLIAGYCLLLALVHVRATFTPGRPPTVFTRGERAPTVTEDSQPETTIRFIEGAIRHGARKDCTPSATVCTAPKVLKYIFCGNGVSSIPTRRLVNLRH